MSPGTRRTVLWFSAPVVVFAVLGGFLSKATAREETYQHLKVFEEVIRLIGDNYVEKVNDDKVMLGALTGLADSLDPDSAFLTAEQVKQIESGSPLPSGDVGIDFTRQYYLRVIATRDGSPAAKAGIRTGDYIRTIGETATRDMSVHEGMRLMRGAPGSKVKLTVMRGGATEPHTIELTRETNQAPDVTSRMQSAGIGYVRVAAIGAKTADLLKAQAADLVKGGASTILVDVRRTSGGSPEHGLALARVFISQGTLAMREAKGTPRESITAKAPDGAISQPAVVLLIDNGTSGAAELFAAALSGNKRAELVGERTIGRAAQQRLVKLPDGTGLWLTTTRYLMPDGSPLHEKGLEPAVPVDEPEVDFGQTPPPGDPILEKAVERATQKKAA